MKIQDSGKYKEYDYLIIRYAKNNFFQITIKDKNGKHIDFGDQVDIEGSEEKAFQTAHKMAQSKIDEIINQQ